MEWVLQSPQIYSTFGNLGFAYGDLYHINENCNATLETILQNILTEDKCFRSYRRSISFGQNVKKDFIPLLIHGKEEKTIELLIRILVNLTIPVECLLSVDYISETNFGRHTAIEINNLLSSIKAAFTDQKVTKVIIDFLKKSLDGEQKGNLSEEQCSNINNSLLLFRNILHIPEHSSSVSPGYNSPYHSVQNQILWNIFSQSIDKVLIKLMTIPDATHWGVTMVQLVALFYKDQHVVTLHKLLNMWLEASISDSSEDNESNTSSSKRGSEDSSPMLTSDSTTSDLSDTGGSGRRNKPNSMPTGWDTSFLNNTSENDNQLFRPPTLREKTSDVQLKSTCIENSSDVTMSTESDDNRPCNNDNRKSETHNQGQPVKYGKVVAMSENSDCGYGTQMENQESISTSSNEDEGPAQKPVHHKPHHPKQRVNNKVRSGITLQERKRKKIVKRGKANIINVQGLSHKTPTADDIANVLKEFTVDFLLKGYNSLVQTLHNKILTSLQLEMDTSHFFWLVTYFLKFATQIELNLEHVRSVLSFDIVSYLTAEGVNLCEQFELAIKLDRHDLKPNIRRLHLLVTAIRDFVQSVEVYKKIAHLCKDDHNLLLKLQIKMCETEDLRSLLVLLLRHYNPKYQSKQYLQDLVVTNHILLMFLDNGMKLPDYNGTTNMADHIKQFATPEIMYQYGLLLENYSANGEFVNDCVFTLMHHVGGDVGCLSVLYQPKILKTFTAIWKTGYEICDDWTDLIEYVINTFIKTSQKFKTPGDRTFDIKSLVDDKCCVKPQDAPIVQPKQEEVHLKTANANTPGISADKRWTEDELSSLNWYYMQCSSLPVPDVFDEIVKLFKEDGINKTRDVVERELVNQKLMKETNKDDLGQICEQLSQGGKSEIKDLSKQKVVKETIDDEVAKICQQLSQDGKSRFLEWVQTVLLEVCFTKICLKKRELENRIKMLNRTSNKQPKNDFSVLSPVSYHSLSYQQSVPLVPWNCEQATICKDIKFLQLLLKLGFQMPVDTGKVFIRIPHTWTAEFLYEVAGKISPIDSSKLKLSTNDISDSASSSTQQNDSMAVDPTKDTIVTQPDNFYQILKSNHNATMVNFTPMPGCSYKPEGGATNTTTNWLEVVRKSQELKLAGMCETAPVASDLTQMYVSDKHEKPKELNRPTAEVRPAMYEHSVDTDAIAKKRQRVD